MVEKKEKVEKVEKIVKYSVRDNHDRFFNLNNDGFDLVIKAGVVKEVTKEIAEVIKEKFSYIEVIES